MSDELKKALAAIATREPTKFVWEGNAADRIAQLERQRDEAMALLKEARWHVANNEGSESEEMLARIDAALKEKENG